VFLASPPELYLEQGYCEIFSLGYQGMSAQVLHGLQS